MVEMELYDTDSLTAANQNRAASKKLFQQLQQTAHNFHLQSLEPQMLHRSPSGAQKRIRQRQEQKWQKSVSSVCVNQPQVSGECGGYRSLINSGAYKSILPEEPPASAPSPPPRPPQRLMAALSTSLTSLNSTISSSFDDSIVPATIISTGKPTVEVHPMPSPRLQNNQLTVCLNPSAELDEKGRKRPAVPRKPVRLLSASNSENSCCPSSSLSFSTSSLNTICSTLTPSQSTESIGRLFSTPSLICLHKAMMLPNLTEEDVEQLEIKRQKVIESISHKIEVLDGERVALDGEISTNECVKKDVFEDLKNAGAFLLIEVIENNLAQHLEIIRLEIRLRMQHERLDSLCMNGDGDGDDKKNYQRKLARLKRQIDDHALLRKAFDRRDAVVDRDATMLLSSDRSDEWRFYKETWKKLMIARKEIEERLSFAKDQIRALQRTHLAI